MISEVFLNCEIDSGYLWNFFEYTDKSLEKVNVPEKIANAIGKSGEVVVRLLEPLLNKGYKPNVDNYYSSPALSLIAST